MYFAFFKLFISKYQLNHDQGHGGAKAFPRSSRLNAGIQPRQDSSALQGISNTHTVHTHSHLRAFKLAIPSTRMFGRWEEKKGTFKSQYYTQSSGSDPGPWSCIATALCCTPVLPCQALVSGSKYSNEVNKSGVHIEVYVVGQCPDTPADMKST